MHFSGEKKTSSQLKLCLRDTRSLSNIESRLWKEIASEHVSLKKADDYFSRGESVSNSKEGHSNPTEKNIQ